MSGCRPYIGDEGNHPLADKNTSYTDLQRRWRKDGRLGALIDSRGDIIDFTIYVYDLA